MIHRTDQGKRVYVRYEVGYQYWTWFKTKRLWWAKILYYWHGGKERGLWLWAFYCADGKQVGTEEIY